MKKLWQQKYLSSQEKEKNKQTHMYFQTLRPLSADLAAFLTFCGIEWVSSL